MKYISILLQSTRSSCSVIGVSDCEFTLFFKHSVLRLFTVLEKITDFYIWAYKQLKCQRPQTEKTVRYNSIANKRWDLLPKRRIFLHSFFFFSSWSTLLFAFEFNCLYCLILRFKLTPKNGMLNCYSRHTTFWYANR